MNKKGSIGLLGIMGIILFAAIVFSAGGYFLVKSMQGGVTKGEIAATGAESATGAATGTGVNIYSSAATFSSTGVSKLQEGTTVGVTGNYRTIFAASTGKEVPGAAFSTSTSGSVGDVVDVFIQNTTGAYYSEYLANQKITGLTPKFEAKMCKNATLTLTMFNADDGLALVNGLTAVACGSGSSCNQSFNSGDAKTMKFKITGSQYGCQPDGSRIYLETNSSDTIDSMIVDLPGVSEIVATTMPSSLSQLGGNEKVAAYDIPSVDGAKVIEGSVTYIAKSSKDPTNMQWKVTVVPKVKFIDSNSGQVVTDIEDSTGTLKALQVAKFGTSQFS